MWLGVWGGWTALALLLAVSTSLSYRSTGRPANWNLTVSRALAEWWLWAALTPLAAWLGHRFPLDGRRRWHHLLLHLAAGLGLAVAKTFADRAILAWLSGFRTYILVSTIALHLVIYASIVAAAHGLRYYQRSREREQLERRLAETRLQLLSMQLQPHFLFNTLNTVAELVHHDPAAADAMIVGLSDLLRMTLDLENRPEITLEEELEVLDRYLEIQYARFGDRLAVDFRVEDDVRGASVPVLLLQPIVENSIRHGLAARLSSGRIEIDARREGNRLRIDVSDDGGLSDEPPAAGRGMGLSNTRARLEALFGEDCRLEFSRLPAGARVSIDIPLRGSSGTS